MRSLALILLAACGSGAPVALGPCVDADCDTRCASKDAAACARAAELYFHGQSGHALDMAKSFGFATQACDAGEMLGCMFVGFHHQDGLGAPWDPAKAIAAYERACTGGTGTACYNLASMYSGGHGVDADQAKADAYNKKAGAAWDAACKGTEPRWCTNAAFLLAGTGKPSDTTQRAMLALDKRACDAKILVGCVEAARLESQLGTLASPAYIAELERLCGAGESTGCTVAGMALAAGVRMDKDVKRGMALVARGCEAGDKMACKVIGMESGLGEMVAKDEVAALRYLTMACDRTDRSACFTVAEIYGQRGDATQMVSFARRGCHMGDAESCGILGSAYRAGRGVEQNETEGRRYLTEACRAGFGPACTVLAELDLELPIPAEYRTKIYTAACERGIATACARAK